MNLSFSPCIIRALLISEISVYPAYRDEEGQPWVLPVVKKTEKLMANDELLNHEYLPVLGLEALSKAATCLLLGEESEPLKEGRVC